MRYLARAVAVVLSLAPTLAGATKIPLGSEGQSLTVSFQLQTWAGLTQDANLAGDGPAFDVRMRRVRALISAEPTDEWAFLLQLDSPNFGLRQDFSPRIVAQDAWVSYAPTGRSAGTVLMIEAGFLMLPLSRHQISSTTSYTTIDVHADAARGFREGPAGRDLGVQVRGWALNKKLGFRGGVFRGVSGTAGELSPTNPRAGLNPESHPRLSAFVNYSILGAEEGNWLYQGIYFAETPIVSIGAGAGYQSKSARGPSGLSDTRLFSGDVFADYPINNDHEAILHATAYRNDFGGGSSDTGWGYFADLGYRYKFVMPYASYEGFSADACPAALAVEACAAGTQNSSIYKAGLRFFINKNANHVDLEFASARSFTTNDADRVNSVLLQWNTVF